MPRPSATCEVCKETFLGWTSNANRFCSLKCKGLATRGANNPNWKGGRSVRYDGRTLVFAPDYPGPKVCGSYVLEYRLVMERHLGRLLREDELVHHINGDPTDNRIENLEIVSAAQHAREHIAENQPRMQAGRRAKKAAQESIQ